MFADRRESERRYYGGAAKIQCGLGSLPRDCTVADISDGGVRIIAENLDVSEEFTLVIPGERPRRCRLAWRIGCEFGAQFIEQHAGTSSVPQNSSRRARVSEYAA